jgi:hypothetical protein
MSEPRGQGGCMHPVLAASRSFLPSFWRVRGRYHTRDTGEASKPRPAQSTGTTAFALARPQPSPHIDRHLCLDRLAARSAHVIRVMPFPRRVLEWARAVGHCRCSRLVYRACDCMGDIYPCWPWHAAARLLFLLQNGSVRHPGPALGKAAMQHAQSETIRAHSSASRRLA